MTRTSRYVEGSHFFTAWIGTDIGIGCENLCVNACVSVYTCKEGLRSHVHVHACTCSGCVMCMRGRGCIGGCVGGEVCTGRW